MTKQKVLMFALILVIVGLLFAIVIDSKGKGTNSEEIQTSADSNSSATSPTNQETPIFYYAKACPHCADVEEWMVKNNIEEKIVLIKKEVYDNRTNASELARAAKSCGLPTNNIGVPFLYIPGRKCLIGTPDIISYLSDKTGISNTNEPTELEK